MKLAYSSQKELHKLVPNKDTIIISLTAREIEVVEDTKWKKVIRYPFKVIDCSGLFKPADDQAKEFAEFMYPHLKDQENIIVQCEYGEIRSLAVARGIAWSDVSDNTDIYSITGGKWVKDDGHGGSSTFSARTTGWISRTLDKKLKEEKETT